MGDSSVDAGQGLALQVETVVNGVRLAKNTVGHVVAVVNAVALLEHIVGLGGLGVVLAVFINVGADVGQEVGAVAGLLEGRLQSRKIPLMARELLAEEGEVVLFKGRRGEGGFGVEEAGELVDDSIALDTGLTRLTKLGRGRIPSEVAPQVSSQWCAPHLWALVECL